jgi:myo-inositol-1(or 4)-monophosphatase
MTVDARMRLAAAAAIAREAGALGLRYYRGRDQLQIEQKGLQDVVTVADRAVETLIRERLAELFPEDAVLGEEGGLLGDGGAPGVWVVDPIDGTWCFVNGIGSWCVSIAYVVAGRIELGVIHDPNAQELFAGRRGGGAVLNGRPLQVSPARTLAEGTLGTGFSHRSKPEEIAPLIGRLLAAGGMFQRHGSGALGLAWTAAGRLIGYVEPHMNSWDCLAGILLVEESSGFANDFLADDGLTRGNRVLAGPAALRTALEELTAW